MVSPAESACLFQRKDVSRLFDDAEQSPGARGVGTDFTSGRGGEETALQARMDRGTRLRDGLRDALRLLIARLHYPKRDPFGRAGTDAGHLAQLRDQLAQGGGIFGSFQSRTSGSATGTGSVAICRQSGSRRGA